MVTFLQLLCIKFVFQNKPLIIQKEIKAQKAYKKL